MIVLSPAHRASHVLREWSFPPNTVDPNSEPLQLAPSLSQNHTLLFPSNSESRAHFLEWTVLAT